MQKIIETPIGLVICGGLLIVAGVAVDIYLPGGKIIESKYFDLTGGGVLAVLVFLLAFMPIIRRVWQCGRAKKNDHYFAWLPNVYAP